MTLGVLGMVGLRELGRYLGYPDCCIEAFVSHAQSNYRDTSDAVLERTHPKMHLRGYIPCNDCFNTFTEDELIARIQERRQHPEPFPHFSKEKA